MFVSPWSSGYQCGMRFPRPGSRVQFPACARLRMLTLGKLANLNQSINGGLFLDYQRANEEVSI